MATVRLFNHHVHSSYYWLALVDAVLLVLSFYLGAYIYFFYEPRGLEYYISQVPVRAALFAVVTVTCLAAMGLYEQRLREGTSGILLRTLGGFVAASVVMVVIFYSLPELHLWRGAFFYTVVVGFTANLISRSLFRGLADMEALKSRVLVYGAGEAANTIPTAMRRKADRRAFNVVGFVRPEETEAEVTTERIINLQQPLLEYVRQTEIDQIVVALDDKRSQMDTEELLKCRMNGIDVVDMVQFFEREAGKILVDHATPSWMTFNEGFRCSNSSKLLKRSFDIVASFTLLMFTWPIMLLTALAIWIEEGFGAPVFFRQTRVGLHGKHFSVLKFRSMTVDAEGDGKARWATPGDNRVTKVGQFIRKTRIDELPQILNVLSGEMAFIGPRPERPEFVAELAASIPYYDVRHCVKPGITGWAQICYPYGASMEDSKQKLQFDLYYVKNHSFFMDCMVFLTTVEVVLFGKGAR